MRVFLGLVGLMIALATVVILSQRQLKAVSGIKAPQITNVAMPVTDSNASVKDQSQQIQQQIKQSLKSAMQQAPVLGM